MADAADLKSAPFNRGVGSSPTSGTIARLYLVKRSLSYFHFNLEIKRMVTNWSRSYLFRP